MVGVVQILTLLAVAVTMALALAHALELPGKMRLSKEAYYAVQPIYYPGFTFAGFAEPCGILLTILLLLVTPLETVDFWLTLAALAGLIAVQAVYWLFTHPVNKFWLQDEKLSRAGSGFFSFAANTAQSRPVRWTELRDRWEYSHVARAVLAFASFSALAIAISL
jgi:Domain of unknown function (DUF1772)